MESRADWIPGDRNRTVLSRLLTEQTKIQCKEQSIPRRCYLHLGLPDKTHDTSCIWISEKQQNFFSIVCFKYCRGHTYFFKKSFAVHLKLNVTGYPVFLFANSDKYLPTQGYVPIPALEDSSVSHLANNVECQHQGDDSPKKQQWY